MPFGLEATKTFEHEYKKLSKKNSELKKEVESKLARLVEDPFIFEPLRSPLQGFRRTHIMKSHVLLYAINEKENSVLLVKLEPHDKVYSTVPLGRN
ncbi:MAG: type II toxin-antitoxin system mRNA interferase toxin, RelE/StbE family [Candidatus Diapherotrites archaeon]